MSAQRADVAIARLTRWFSTGPVVTYHPDRAAADAVRVADVTALGIHVSSKIEMIREAAPCFLCGEPIEGGGLCPECRKGAAFDA